MAPSALCYTFEILRDGHVGTFPSQAHDLCRTVNDCMLMHAAAQWAGSEDLPRAAHTACQMLRWRQDGSEAVSKLQLAVLGAARAVGATHPATSAAIVGSVHVAEAAAAGRRECSALHCGVCCF